MDMAHSEHLMNSTVIPIPLNQYKPMEHEREKASNSYLMSLLAIMVGLPLPIINLIATTIFFFAHRKESLFIRWHCTQALLQQFTVLVMNSVGFAWTMKVIFSKETATDEYIAYMVTIVLFNLFEFILSIVAAILVRQGRHVRWWFWADLTDALIIKKELDETPAA